MTKAIFAPVALAAALFGAASFAQETPTPNLSMDDVVVRAGESMEFAEVTMDQAGWIVVHDGLAGAPVGASLTQVFVNPGVHQGVLVPLEGGFQAGKEYIISLHYDSNGNGTWDYETNAADDGPVIRADGSVYSMPFVMQAAQ
jgi:hypothetical protein